VSPLTSGKLSHSSEPLIGGGSSIIQWWKDKCCYWHATACSGPKSKTIGRQLKERREKRKRKAEHIMLSCTLPLLWRVLLLL
jgi:hypothetical protein